MGVPEQANNLYTLGETKKANELLLKYADFIQKEVSYLADVSDSKKKLVGQNNIQMGLYYGLEPMAKVANKHNQQKLSAKLQQEYESLISKFSMYFSQ